MKDPELIDGRVALVGRIINAHLYGEDAKLQPRQLFNLHEVAAEIVAALDRIPESLDTRIPVERV